MPRMTKAEWIGWVMTILAALVFALSGVMKLLRSPQVVQGFGHLGWPESMIFTVGILEVTSVVLYLIPRLSVLGAIVLTGFLGGAIATHLRIGEPVVMHIVLGLLIWGGLYLREPRLREILPLRKASPAPAA
jgi:uncharacterized membrane protein YphA (DoxX/SURF4 family)